MGPRRLFKRIQVPLLVVTGLLGVYVAVTTLLSASDSPNADVWRPWGVLFITRLGSVVLIGVYVLVRDLEARVTERERDAAVIRTDIEITLQEIAAYVVQHSRIDVVDLSTALWVVRGEGDEAQLERRYRFLLAREQPPSGVTFRKGQGVVGVAWRDEAPCAPDLKALYAKLDELGSAPFDRLPTEDRLGMTAQDLTKTRTYTSVVARPLFDANGSESERRSKNGDENPQLLGLFVVDYKGEGDIAGLTELVLEDAIVAGMLGTCQDALVRLPR